MATTTADELRQLAASHDEQIHLTEFVENVLKRARFCAQQGKYYCIESVDDDAYNQLKPLFEARGFVVKFHAKREQMMISWDEDSAGSYNKK